MKRILLALSALLVSIIVTSIIIDVDYFLATWIYYFCIMNLKLATACLWEVFTKLRCEWILYFSPLVKLICKIYRFNPHNPDITVFLAGFWDNYTYMNVCSLGITTGISPFYVNCFGTFNPIQWLQSYFVSTIFCRYVAWSSIIFALKFILLIALLVFVRGGIPRYRYDFLTKVGWIQMLNFILLALFFLILHYLTL